MNINKTPKVEPRKILVVDDDYFFRSILEKSLAHRGYLPSCAEGGKQAQQMLSLDKFDLVISDIRMPGIDGTELLRWIKESGPLPVILMAECVEILETQGLAEIGADGFLEKPFKTEALLAAIEACFPPLKEKKVRETLISSFAR